MNNILTVCIIHNGNSVLQVRCLCNSQGNDRILEYLLQTTANHTIAVVKGKEEYQLLKTSLANVINEETSVCREGAVEVKGKKVKIQLYLGGDYKVKSSWYHLK